MEKILLLAHTEADGLLAKPALEALTTAIAATEGLPGAVLMVGLVGTNVQPAADQLAACGAAKFLAVTGPEFGESRYGTDALAFETLARQSQATLVLAPATPRCNRVLPGVAHRLGGKADTHATGLSTTGKVVQVQRWFYRQRIEATLQRPQRPWVVLLEIGCAAPWQETPGKAQVDLLPVQVPDSLLRTRTAGIQTPAAAQQTIRPEAELLFVAGAGWTKKQADGQPHLPEAETLIRDFLGHSRASLGSSKSLVDLSGEGQAVLSFLTHMNQIGQTGATPRHPKGLATCCHGEEPHTVGWRFIHERRAVNLDPNCGWARGKADVLYVGDAFAVMRQLNELLAKRTP